MVVTFIELSPPGACRNISLYKPFFVILVLLLSNVWIQPNIKLMSLPPYVSTMKENILSGHVTVAADNKGQKLVLSPADRRVLYFNNDV